MQETIQLTEKVIAQIPARASSQRVEKKNLRYLAGKPMIQHAINAAMDADFFDDVIVNSDSEDILHLAESLGTSTYRRPSELASDIATGDAFTYDFIKQFRPKTLILVNPACPLVETSDILKAFEAFNDSDCDTLITSSATRMPTFCDGDPVNVGLDGPMQPTQNNPKVETLNWAIAVWDVAKYIENYETQGHAYMGIKRELLEIDPWKAVKISVESDFQFAELLLTAKKVGEIGSSLFKYWSRHEEA
jgi:CMP-N-acetylneuraminic acid synthetase